jgi:hypothetical protein
MYLFYPEKMKKFPADYADRRRFLPEFICVNLRDPREKNNRKMSYEIDNLKVVMFLYFCDSNSKYG